ncbi:MAG: hemolysin hemolytic protein [Prevotella sp.]|nr:hemolysin hemolytic protein [Prevotella sp.]
MYNIPILFIIFRRKDIALTSFERIKSVKPARLYIACDGPRPDVEGEETLVEETRQAILDAIDWDCEVNTLFQKNNLGCSLGVYTAINWLFEHEEEGIILEDDCIANASFFAFVAEMLAKYRDDDRVGMIAGTNQIAKWPMQHSYCFSKYAACWGWATWRRAWKNIDINLSFFPKEKRNILKNRGYQGKDTDRWRYQIDMIEKQRVSAWDWQWYFSLAAQNQLCIFPKVNLISNIGNDQAATHTAFSNIFIQSHELSFPLDHPKYVMPDDAFDHRFYKKENSLLAIVKRKTPYSIKQFIKHHLL